VDASLNAPETGPMSEGRSTEDLAVLLAAAGQARLALAQGFKIVSAPHMTPCMVSIGA
jgi:hypothetical protein